jgi:hypothetical protein
MRIDWKKKVPAMGVAFVVLVSSTACDSGTAPGEKPTRADVAVVGEAPVPLELVVSTDFFETVRDGEVVQVKNSADTLFIEPPFAQTFFLSDLGSVLVELANHDAEPAQVELSVELDSGQEPYRQSATMSEGGRLRYVFVFLQRTL